MWNVNCQQCGKEMRFGEHLPKPEKAWCSPECDKAWFDALPESERKQWRSATVADLDQLKKDAFQPN